MLEAILVVYSACVARMEKENHMNIFGGVYHIGYRIILHGNMPHKQIRKQKQQYTMNSTTIHPPLYKYQAFWLIKVLKHIILWLAL